MRDEVRQALTYQAMVESGGGEEKAIHAFSQAVLEMDTKEDISIHADRYAELLSVPATRLMDAYYRLRPAYELIPQDIRILTWEDSLWPKVVDDFSYLPRFLFLKGDLSLLSHEGISLIGTGNPSVEGKALCVQTVEKLGSKGFCIVSGMDIGVEGVALRSALHGGFPVLAVLSTQMGECYPPQHDELQKEVEAKGLAVSRFSPAVTHQKWFLLLANRLSSALSKATVIIEDRDGGPAVRQAMGALSCGRPVFLFKKAYDNQSLLWPREMAKKKGVHVVKNADEVARILHPTVRKRKKEKESVPDGQLVLL